MWVAIANEMITTLVKTQFGYNELDRERALSGDAHFMM
jgi:hypothetical protein